MTYTPAAGVSTIGKVKLPSYFMLALTLIGIADAVYVAHGNYTGAPLWCPILDGCNTVINSPYSRVFGVPMSYFGFIYYVFLDWQRALLTIRSQTVCASAQFFTLHWALLRRCTLCTFRSALLAKFVVIASSPPSRHSSFFSPRSGTFKRPAIGNKLPLPAGFLSLSGSNPFLMS